jgi:hypothetical protein
MFLFRLLRFLCFATRTCWNILKGTN